MDHLPPAPASASNGFFGDLPVLQKAGDTFDTSQYRPAPDDWLLVVTDIVDSTVAIANGQHKTVNFVAAMAIAALKNLCAPTPLPFLFGGDGSVVMVPPQHADAARLALARVRGFALREFAMQLRVGLAPVAALRRFGSEVLVGRFEPTPGNSFGVFLGGGVGMLETAVRGRGDPALIALAAIAPELDDGVSVDLAGLSCRWNPLQSGRAPVGAVAGRECVAALGAFAQSDSFEALEPVSSIFEGFLSTPEAMQAFGERSFVDAMLRFEASLARAQAAVGLIPEALT